MTELQSGAPLYFKLLDVALCSSGLFGSELDGEALDDAVEVGIAVATIEAALEEQTACERSMLAPELDVQRS